NPSVNQPWVSASMCPVSARRPWVWYSRLRLTTARSSRDLLPCRRANSRDRWKQASALSHTDGSAPASCNNNSPSRRCNSASQKPLLVAGAVALASGVPPLLVAACAPEVFGVPVQVIGWVRATPPPLPFRRPLRHLAVARFFLALPCQGPAVQDLSPRQQ